jgi:glycosyltransferase involved in cell wall biosynthesis
VSVIISVWNGANYLAEAIESVLRQDYADRELIVVDDGSTDATARVMESFAGAITRLHRERRGAGAGRNAGVRAARGTLLAFLDHDDLWERTKLGEQVRHLDAHAALDPLIFSRVQQFVCPRLSPAQKSRIALNTAPMPGFVPGALLLSRARFEEVGFFTEKTGVVGEFVEWYMKAAEKKVPIAHLETVGLRRRVHLSNMGRQAGYSRGDYLKILKAGLDRRRQAGALP